MTALMPPPVPRRAPPGEEKIAIFIIKTFNLVEQASKNGMAGWSEAGTHLCIHDVQGFTQLLPNFFRHSNFRSFIRQLNCYGFRKFRSEEIRQLPGTSAQAEAVFLHPQFQRGRRDLLTQIRIKRDGDSSELEELRGEVSSLQEQVAELSGLVHLMLNRPKRRCSELAAPSSPAAVVEDLDHYHQLLEHRAVKRARLARGSSTESTDSASSAMAMVSMAAAAAAAASTFAAAAVPKQPSPLAASTSWDVPALSRLTSSSSLGPEMEELSFLLDGAEAPSLQMPRSLPGLGLTDKSMENLLKSEDSVNNPAALCCAPPALPALLSRISVTMPGDPSQ
eukprot:CAMPEP_0118973764 /NCGR_PEP_ID=MMETSP1173-20130426/10896_1 /TAXON_ID=1034831 /ORGANISM="Rhizochromulina marina cf, Strain CCMP1243" /LENGTH=335 /DNA_ID=CAMNT_0006923457 /DNA_START=33 /DNA_END=1040 /DNA_ORIENTATION=+